VAQLLRDSLALEAARNFVGRTQEVDQLLHILNEQDVMVVFVHGVGGIGKSSLLEVFASQAQGQGAVVIKLDCRTIKPSEEGFLLELHMAIGGDSTDLEAVATRLSQLGERVILALDTYEVFRMMDTWLRQVFIPSLGDTVRVVLFGREAPVSAWFTTPGWSGMVQSLRLDPLNNSEAEQLLLQCGVAQSDILRVTQFTHGHPLALKLAAAAMVARPDLTLKEVESQHVIRELTELYLSDVSDPAVRTALETASVVRRITRSLLGAMLPDSAPNDIYDRLQAIPFIESASDGLMIHDLIQQAIAAQLRSSDPERYDHYRRLAWQQLRSEFSVGSRASVWRYTADMLYLIDHPGVHNVFFPTDVHLYAVEPATPNDAAAVFALTLQFWGAEMVTIIEKWWQLQPTAFYVARGRQMDVAGFYCLLKVRHLADAAQFDDPVTHQWWQHLQANPVSERQLTLMCLSIVAAETGDAPSAIQGSLWLDIKRTYMEFPQTRRVYVIFQSAKIWTPVLESLGFDMLDSVRLDGTSYATMVNDFGPQLVHGWMARLVDTQLGSTPPPVTLDVDARELVVNNQHVGLTHLEFELMRYLVQHEEKAVSRDELLNAVWGYDYTGGSNVVDAMIRSLRKKLGNYSQCIETVSGVGYKLRWN
jgi:hypothetical protein